MSKRNIFFAKLQNTGPLIYISLNHKSAYCVMPPSSKDLKHVNDWWSKVALHYEVVHLCMNETAIELTAQTLAPLYNIVI